MDFVYGLLFWGGIILIAKKLTDMRKYQRNQTPECTYTPSQHQAEEDKEISFEYKRAYQAKWMFTYNEKAAYKVIKRIADENGLIVFAKVRLLDIIEPIKNHPQYKTYFYKIQAKHVDFVLCNNKLVAKYIIEIDDRSHNNADRKARDSFVDTILEATGYKVIRSIGYEEETLRNSITQKIYS